MNRYEKPGRPRSAPRDLNLDLSTGQAALTGCIVLIVNLVIWLVAIGVAVCVIVALLRWLGVIA